MRQTSTSRSHSSPETILPGGFSVVELLVGLALALCLATAAAPLWLSLESAGVQEAERTVQWLQGRVALARLERDLRLASSRGCLFVVDGPVLDATASQVVFLEHSADASPPVLVEWEMTGDSLMRRWGPCPIVRPSVFGHGLFTDHKTMLERLEGRGAFTYVVGGAETDGPIPERELTLVDAVILRMTVGDQLGQSSENLGTEARVGR